jgi:hypothetical protein
MKSLTNAIFSVATALNRIAAAIENKSSVQTVTAYPTTVTSNPSTSTKTTIYTPLNPSTTSFSYDLKIIIDDIYKALSDKGSYPEHHDHVLRELKIKWPVLHNALQRLQRNIDESKDNWKSYSKFKSNSKYNSDIWKNKHNHD